MHPCEFDRSTLDGRGGDRPTQIAPGDPRPRMMIRRPGTQEQESHRIWKTNCRFPYVPVSRSITTPRRPSPLPVFLVSLCSLLCDSWTRRLGFVLFSLLMFSATRSAPAATASLPKDGATIVFF